MDYIDVRKVTGIFYLQKSMLWIPFTFGEEGNEIFAKNSPNR